MPSVFRFAPSPNGELHLGHALSALYGYERARQRGGRFLVRIEDIDTARCRDAFVAGIFDDLTWLGVPWERPVLRQSERFDAYRAAAGRLAAMGLLYPCFATRTDIARHATPGLIDPDGAPLYPGLHKTLPASEVAERTERGEPVALRIDMAKAVAVARAKRAGAPLTFTERGLEPGAVRTIPAEPELWGDAVIVRKDTPSSYHLAVVVDDAAQGVTDVSRGQDLFAATHLHRLLQVLLDLPEPQYWHHPLVRNPEGEKLSKSAGDTALRSLRESGMTAAEVRRRLGFSANPGA